ncbi:hypothetical protein LCGC14_0473550, partial [marine sediment metagenome]
MSKRNIKVIAMIPARGGSKGIARKNIVDLNGLPLLAYSIISSLGSNVSETWVSTEDSEIEEIAKVYGAKVLRRPVILAEDETSTEAVVEHFLGKVNCDVLVLIQSTSPMILAKDIDGGLEKFFREGYDSLFSAVKTNDMLFWN